MRHSPALLFSLALALGSVACGQGRAGAPIVTAASDNNAAAPISVVKPATPLPMGPVVAPDLPHAFFVNLGELPGLTLVLTDRADFCDAWHAEASLGGATALTITGDFRHTDMGGDGNKRTLAVGFGTVGTHGELTQNDATCKATAQAASVGGTVTLDSLDDTHCIGTYEIDTGVLADDGSGTPVVNGHLHGTFDAQPCPDFENVTPSACK